MRLDEFMVAMQRAEERARTTGLTPSDLTLVRDAGRAWKNAGSPTEGALADVWAEALRVFAIGEARDLELLRDAGAARMEIAQRENEIAALERGLKGRNTKRRKAERQAVTQARIDKGVRWAQQG